MLFTALKIIKFHEIFTFSTIIIYEWIFTFFTIIPSYKIFTSLKVNKFRVSLGNVYILEILIISLDISYCLNVLTVYQSGSTTFIFYLV